MRKSAAILVVLIAALFLSSCSSSPTVAERLRTMREGVWIDSGGGYTVWTDSYYFVVSAAGDSTSANIYCGASQVVYTNQGVARKQNLRLRETPRRDRVLYNDYSVFLESDAGGIELAPLQIDTGLFNPDACVIKDGVIYDSVAEVTEESILLSSCNGDKVRIYENGQSVYLPADGGEHWSYRVESLR